MYSEKFLKISIKLLRSPFSVMLKTCFTRRALKGHWDTQGTLRRHSKGLKHSKSTRRAIHRHSKGTLAIKAIEHSSTWGIRTALRHLGIQGTLALEGNLSTRALNILRHLATLAPGHLKGTWALRDSSTRVIGHSPHFI